MPETSLSEKGLGAIGLGEDLEHLRDSVRGLLRRHISEDVVRNAVEAKEELLPTWWSALAQNGLLGLHLAEEHGGAGFGLKDRQSVVTGKSVSGRVALGGGRSIKKKKQ